MPLILAGETSFSKNALFSKTGCQPQQGKDVDSDQEASLPFTFPSTGCNPTSFVGSNQPKGFSAKTKVSKKDEMKSMDIQLFLY